MSALIALVRAQGAVGARRIETAEEIASIAAELLRETHSELCSMLTGGPYPLPYLMGSWDEDLELMARGIHCKALYQADAVREPGVLRYLSDFVAAGAQVRVARRVAHRTIIADQQVVIVAVDEDQLSGPFLVVREPALVDTFRRGFVQSWQASSSVGLSLDDGFAAETVADTVAILESGVTDEVAARQLGVSARTIRRRVAAVMELLDADSRFEAGVKAARAGWV